MGLRAGSARGRLWFAGLLVALGWGTLGCPRFRPIVPMHAQTGDIDIGLKLLRTGPARAFVLESRSSLPHALVRGWLTVASRTHCSGGAEIESFAVDELPSMVLAPGSHEIVVRFSDGLDDYSLDTVIDLELDDGSCVRAPVISQSIPMVAEKRPLLTFSSVILGNTNLSGPASGLVSIISFEVGAGVWAGPVLLNVQAGFAQANCSSGTCAKQSDGSLGSSYSVPLAAEARYAFGAGVVNKLESDWFVGARYAFTPIRLPTFEGDRSFQTHAVQGVLGWGFGDALRGPFLHLERVIPFELAVPLGVLAVPGGGIAFTGGVEFRFLLPL